MYNLSNPTCMYMCTCCSMLSICLKILATYLCSVGETRRITDHTENACTHFVYDVLMIAVDSSGYSQNILAAKCADFGNIHRNNQGVVCVLWVWTRVNATVLSENLPSVIRRCPRCLEDLDFSLRSRSAGACTAVTQTVATVTSNAHSKVCSWKRRR